MDEAGDIVGVRKTGRHGEIIGFRKDKTVVKHSKGGFLAPAKGDKNVEVKEYKKKDLFVIAEKRDLGSHVRKAERSP